MIRDMARNVGGERSVADTVPDPDTVQRIEFNAFKRCLVSMS